MSFGDTTVVKRKLARSEMEQEVTKLVKMGYTTWEISRKLDKSQSYIQVIIGKVRNDFLRNAERDYAETKAEQIAKIQFLYTLSMEAWFRSCENAEIETSTIESALRAVQKIERGVPPKLHTKINVKLKTVQVPDDTVVVDPSKGALSSSEKNPEQKMTVIKERTNKVSKGQSGNPAFLEICKGCIEMICKIQGIYQDINVNVAALSPWDMLAMVESQQRDSVAMKVVEGLPPLENANGS